MVWLPWCGAVTRNLKSIFPAVTAVAGQSARGRSRALYLSRPAEQSLPSGISAWWLPAALARLTSFQSYSGWVPLSATRSLQICDLGVSGPSA
ncbi:hypothetical protein VR45_19420 [Streptomyces sp. NRRL S-495]|nr:hypothetical protein VR45_19420 [Streptomyces sp. NRRL S-495]